MAEELAPIHWLTGRSTDPVMQDLATSLPDTDLVTVFLYLCLYYVSSETSDNMILYCFQKKSLLRFFLLPPHTTDH